MKTQVQRKTTQRKDDVIQRNKLNEREDGKKVLRNTNGDKIWANDEVLHKKEDIFERRNTADGMKREKETRLWKKEYGKLYDDNAYHTW